MWQVLPARPAATENSQAAVPGLAFGGASGIANHSLWQSYQYIHRASGIAYHSLWQSCKYIHIGRGAPGTFERGSSEKVQIQGQGKV